MSGTPAIADPPPPGLAAFAPRADLRRMAHLLAGMWEFRRGNTLRALALVLLLLTVTYFLLGIGDSATSSFLIEPGGWVGLCTAAAAWYASCAGVTNATFRRTVLPVAPLTR